MMPFRRLFALLALSTIPIAMATALPATNTPPASPAPVNRNAGNVPVVASLPNTPTFGNHDLKLDDYMKNLTTELKLSDSEKQEIESYYVADGIPLQKILNDESLSPLQQAQQVADVRITRNAKIDALLYDLDRQQKFLQIEARYRVALTELAANGGLVAAPSTPISVPAIDAPASQPAPPAPAAKT